MSENPHLKYLKGFDPSSLVIDESFNLIISARAGFTLSEKCEKVSSKEPGKTAENHLVLKTGGAIHSSCVHLPIGINSEIFAVANLKGEIYFFEHGDNALRTVSRVALPGSIYSTPLFFNGVLYCVMKDGIVYAIETGFGSSPVESDIMRNRVLWQKKMKKGVLTEPVIAGKLVLVTAFDGIYAFDTSVPNGKSLGTPVWAVSINGTVSTPAVDSGMLFIGSEDKRLFGFNYEGEKLQKLWEYELSGPCRMKPYISANRGYVTVATLDGFIYAIDRISGEHKWSFAVKSPVLGNVASCLINDDELFYFGSDSGEFFCINSKGKIMWKSKTGGKIRTEPVVYNGNVFFGSADNSLYALDTVTGKVVYRFYTEGNSYGRPLVSDGRLIFGSTDGIIHSIKI